MGFVQREAKKVFVRTDNFQIIKDRNKAKELLVKDLAIERKGVIIIIYPEYDFEAFYRKHCLRIPNDNKSFTVLVEEDIKIPNKNAVRKLVEEVLLSKDTEFSEKTVFVEIQPKLLLPTKYKVRTFFNNDFQDESRNGLFRFRDINYDIKQKEIMQFNNSGLLSNKEYNNIKKIWESSFVLDCDYAIKYILLIGHLDVIQAQVF